MNVKILILCSLIALASCESQDSQNNNIEIHASQWISDTVDPADSIGQNKDFYINSTSGDFFEKIAGVWVAKGKIGGTGATGEKGDKGEKGDTGSSTKWISGTIDPTNEGNDGDFYYNTVSSNVYEKNSGVWSLVSNIKGLQGAKGDTGAQGIQGVKGDTGATGEQGIQGLKGDTGATGAQGIQGVKGDTGATGEQGIQGLKGDTGAQGIQGLKGDTGATGAQGIQGVKGDNGLSTIAGKTVQTTDPSGDKEVLVYDQATQSWISTKINLVNTVGSLEGTRVSGDISGRASGITGFIEMLQVNGLSSALTSVSDQIAQLFGQKADKTQVASDIAAAKSDAEADATTKANLAESNSKSYTDNKVTSLNSDLSGKLSLSGGTMTGDLALNGKTDTDELSSNPSLTITDKAKMWFNKSINRIKFWDGSAAKQVAIKDEVDLKVDTTTYNEAIADINDSIGGVLVQNDSINAIAQSAATGLSYKEDKANLKALAYKDNVSNTEITDVAGSKITGSVSASLLTGFIDGLNKTLTGVTNLVTATFSATTGTIATLNSTDIVASNSIKVGSDNVLTTASTIPSASISDASLGGSASKLLKLGTDGKIDSSALPSISASLVDNSTGKFIQAGNNSLGSANVNLISTGGSVKVSSTDTNYASGLIITNDSLGTATSVQEAAVDVQGSIISRTYTNPVSLSNYINMKKSNAIRYRYSTSALSTTATETINLTGLIDGGAYSVIIDGSSTSGCRANGADGSCVRTGAATYTFVSTGYTFKYQPTNAAADLGKDTIYNFMVVGSIVYVNWSSGF